MKVFSLLFFVGCALASQQSEYQWQRGQQHVFEYSGRLLTGIPQLASHYSGLGINATVLLDVLDQNQLQLSLENARFVKVNQRLEPRLFSQDGRDGANWREVHLPQMSQADQQIQKILEQPIVFNLEQGEISQAKISKSEPQWSVNFKKALALLFQTKVDAASWKPEENQVSSSQNNYYWQTTEQGIDGICQVTYQVNELPKYMIRDRPDLIPNPEQCQGQEQYYEITKTKNVNTCERRSAYQFFQPGQFKCQGPNCKNMWARTSETRVIACGSARGQLKIQTIVNQGELNQNLMGFKTEKFVSGNLQMLRLKEVRSASPKPQPQDQVTVHNMMYEYSQESYQSQQAQQEEEERHSRVPQSVIADAHKLAKVLPQSWFQGIKSDVSIDQIKQEAKKLIQVIVREMSAPQAEDMGKKQVSMKVLSAVRGISMLKKFDMESLYQQLKSEFSQDQVHETTAKSLFNDIVLMTGTPESIKFLKEQVQKNEMTTYQVFSLLYWLPNSVQVPSQAVLETVFELIQTQKVQQSRLLENVATMSFSTLLEKACLSETKDLHYPTWVMGSFCNAESEILNKKWLPYLASQLESSQSWTRRNEIIVALGLLPLQQNIGKLVPYLEGKSQQQQEVPKMTRLLALWSLTTAGYKQPQVIEPILYSLYANPAEATEIRISSFNALMKINPSIAVFQKIAARTWTEQDKEVLRAVNTAFFTLARESKYSSNSNNLQVFTLAKKARNTYPMIKKTPISLISTASVYGGEYLSRMQSGYQTIASVISSQKSFLPKDMYFQINAFLSQYQFTPLAVGMRLHGVENAYRRLAELLAPAKAGQSVHEQKQEIVKQIEESLSSQWRKIAQELNIQPRDTNNKMSGAAFMRVQETTPLFANFQDMTVEALKEKINEIFENPQQLKESITGKQHQIHIKRAANLAPYQGMIASDMGMPLTIELHMPIVASLDAKLHVQQIFPKPEAKLETRAFVSSQYVAWIGTPIPFTQEYAFTGFNEVKSLNIPATVKINIDLPKQQVKLALQMDKTVTKPMDLVYHHAHPFTAVQNIKDLTPITLSSNKKIIKSQDKVHELQYNIGESIGLSLSSKLRTESRFADWRSIVERLALYNYNPINMAIFSWSSFGMDSYAQPSLRMHEYQLRYNPAESTTQEMSVNLRFGGAAKKADSDSVEYQKIKVLSKAEQQKEVEQEKDMVKKQLKKLIPLKLVSESLESKQSHPERQEKLEKVMKKVMESTSSNKKMSAKAYTVKVSATIEGKRPQTWTYFATVAGSNKPEPSQRKSQTQWAVEVESKQTQNKVVLEGKIQSPVLPVWDIHAIRSSMIDYSAFTSLQYFQNANKQWNIDVDTKAQTTHDQREYSRTSPEAIRCQKLEQQKESGLRPVMAKLSEACQAMRLQASSLDEVQITIKYNNVPQVIRWAETRTVEVVKALLWSFKMVDNSQISMNSKNINQGPVYVRILFNKRTPSFDLTVTRPQEKMSYANIRLPYPLNVVLPLKAGQNNIKLAAQKATAHSLFPVCKVEGKSVQTFDNRTFPLYLDQCFHLVAADCSKQQLYGVLARQLAPSSQQKELQVFLGQSEIRIQPQSSQLKVSVDGQQVRIQENQWQSLKSQQGQYLGQIFLAQNNVVQIYAPAYALSLTFDGRDAAVETSQYLKGQQCGICGNQNQQTKDEMEGPQFCMYSEAEIQNAAYRLPNYPQGCDQKQPLSQSIKQKLQEQNQQCHKRHAIYTKISKSLKTQNGPCTILKHAVLRRPNQVCFSKRQVTQCAAGCQAAHAELLDKKIAFTCLKEDRVAEHYVKKAERGEKLPELQQRQTNFETKVPQPRTCVPASNEL